METKQAYYQPQVTTGKRQEDQLLIAGYFWLCLLTSGNYAGLLPQCVVTWNHQPIRPAAPVLTCAGNRPAFFPPLFFAPANLGYKMEKSRVQNILRPPLHSKQDKTFCTHPFKEWKLFAPLLRMTKTSSSHVKLPQNFLCPLFSKYSTAETFYAHLFVGVKLHFFLHKPRWSSPYKACKSSYLIPLCLHPS